MRDFRELKVWEKSHRLALDTYKATARWPKEEAYGSTSQIRRACVSIPANIACPVKWCLWDCRLDSDCTWD